ncbi:MAG: UDP-N-acetylmuramate dehydrogenase [Alphaproteobacteria bacterium]|nr:UDP-N-acetylmuramate dehydrogenase [Alphaproteobacteria bacterium]MDE1931223.1 UDP-N-acetylmuramate dehydrogenase [Alphaproteobacteria bacterium]
MMALRREPTPRLIERLPRLRGRLTENAPLAQLTWFRVGGAAEVMFRPADLDDLAAFLAGKPTDVPVTVMGVASNLLIRDGGVPGVVIRLGRGFVDIVSSGDEITAGAGALDLNVALAACTAGIADLEFLSGIPGTVGGGLRMNAGAYGREFKDVLREVTALDGEGHRHDLEPGEMDLSYRHCGVPADWIFVAAQLKGRRDDPSAIGARMAAIQAQREATQPIRARTGGSTFANPPGHKAWELIDRAGCRGLTRGGAAVSDKHTNFLINTGNATAADLEALGEEVRRRVRDTAGIVLEWEIKRIGVPAASGGAT